jgi:hypothetical protein
MEIVLECFAKQLKFEQCKYAYLVTGNHFESQLVDVSTLTLSTGIVLQGDRVQTSFSRGS